MEQQLKKTEQKNYRAAQKAKQGHARWAMPGAVHWSKLVHMRRSLYDRRDTHAMGRGNSKQRPYRVQRFGIGSRGARLRGVGVEQGLPVEHVKHIVRREGRADVGETHDCGRAGRVHVSGFWAWG